MYEDIIGEPKKEVKETKVERIEKNDEEGFETYKVGDQVIKIYKRWMDSTRKSGI